MIRWVRTHLPSDHTSIGECQQWEMNSMTVTDFDNRTVTFVKGGQEVTLTWGELNFLKHLKTGTKEDPSD